MHTGTRHDQANPSFPTWIVLRFLFHTLVLILIGSILPLFAGESSGSGFYAERGPIEIMQLLLLLVMFVLFLFYGRLMPQWRHLSIFLAGFPLFALLRETDFLLGHWIPLVGWKIAGVVVIGVAVWAYRHWTLLLPQMVLFMRTRAFGLIWAGTAIVVVLAQLLGTSDLLQAMMGEDYVRHYKRVIEESCELLGYAVLLCGTIEYGFCCNEH